MKQYNRSYFETIFTENVKERQAIAQYKFQLLKQQKTAFQNILDLGCGYGVFLAVCQSNKIETYGIDIAKEALKFTRELVPEAKLTKLDIAKKKLPFKNNYFDVVSCFDVVEHFKDPNLLFSEVNRVLKSRGIFFLITPVWTVYSKILRQVVSDDPTHTNRQEISYWERKLKENNFVVTDKKYAFLFGIPPIASLRTVFRKISLPTLTRPFFLPLRGLCTTLFIFAQKR